VEATAAPRPACPAVGAPERLSLAAGESAVTASGLTVAFDGSTADHYEDGSFDTLLHLRFVRDDEVDQWLPSMFATPVTPVRPILGHCVTLEEGAPARIALTVALSAEP
jgi:hypothetical protein